MQYEAEYKIVFVGSLQLYKYLIHVNDRRKYTEMNSIVVDFKEIFFLS